MVMMMLSSTMSVRGGRVSAAAAAAPRRAPAAARRPVALAPGRRQVAVAMAAAPTPPQIDFDADKFMADIKAKWDGTEDKKDLLIKGGGALVGFWAGVQLLSVVNHVPPLSAFFKTVGLGYTTWFAYRYLLFASTREELSEDIDTLKDKILGDK